MSIGKIKLLAYMSVSEKARVKKRARHHSKTIGDFIAELVIWEEQLDLFTRARRGEIKKK